MRRCVLLSFVILVVGFAPAPFPRAERRGKAVNEMLGLWGPQGHVTLEITQDKMIYSPGPGAYEYALRITPNTRPAGYSIRGIAQQNNGWEFIGIYKVEGDTLTLCYNSGNTNKPTAFEGAGKGTFTEVYKRVRR
jgi:uncharacterized protein (TIGR03067 family)